MTREELYDLVKGYYDRIMSGDEYALDEAADDDRISNATYLNLWEANYSHNVKGDNES